MNKRQLQFMNDMQMQIEFLEKEIAELDEILNKKESICYTYQKPLVLFSGKNEKFNRRLQTQRKKIDKAYLTYIAQIRRILKSQLIYLKIQMSNE